MSRILIVKRDKLGDLLLTVPLIDLLAREIPGVRIDVWATSFTTFLIADHPSVNRVWHMRKRFSNGPTAIVQALFFVVQLLKLRGQDYDWVISASGEISTRAIRRARLAGGKRLVSFVPDRASPAFRSHLRVTHGIKLPPPNTHESVRIARLAEPIVGGRISWRETPLPSLHLKLMVKEMGPEYAKRMGLNLGRFVVLGLGARKDKRRPSVSQILTWSQYLLVQGYQSVLSYTPGKPADPGYPSDEVMAREILSSSHCIVPLCGSIQEAVAVISIAAFSVIPDSGLMHVAAASEGGVIGLFADPDHSPTPEQWGPRGAHCKIIVAQGRVSELSDQLIFESFEDFIRRDRFR